MIVIIETRISFKVKPRENDVNSRMSKMDLETVLVKEGHPCRASLDEAIPENNMGHKLLRLMGWSGGGLGKAGNEGIIEPVRFV